MITIVCDSVTHLTAEETAAVFGNQYTSPTVMYKGLAHIDIADILNHELVAIFGIDYFCSRLDSMIAEKYGISNYSLPIHDSQVLILDILTALNLPYIAMEDLDCMTEHPQHREYLETHNLMYDSHPSLLDREKLAAHLLELDKTSLKFVFLFLTEFDSNVHFHDY